jgi:hypothetical protein
MSDTDKHEAQRELMHRLQDMQSHLSCAEWLDYLTAIGVTHFEYGGWWEQESKERLWIAEMQERGPAQ